MTITPGGGSRYIYKYIMHNASTQNRKVNRGRHTLALRTNSTCHDIPNTTHLREKGRRKEGRGFKRVHNQMGEARPLKILNIYAWFIFTCLRLCPFCLGLGDRALAPCVLTPCVYMKRQRQKTSRQAMEGKDAKSI